MIKKKILYIHHGKGLGGAPLSLLYLIEGLDKNRFDPIVLFLHNSQAVSLFENRGIKIAGIVGQEDFPHSKIRWYRWYHSHIFLRSVLDSLKTLFITADYWFNKIKPDLVHLNTSSLSLWAKVANKRNIPVVWHIREPLAKGYFGLRKFLITKSVERYSNIIFPICKNDGLPWNNYTKLKVLYNTVDSKKFDKDISSTIFLKKYKLTESSPKILFLGGLSKEKGTLEILNIFEKLLKKAPNAKLIIAGYFDLDSKNFLSPKYYFPVESYKREVSLLVNRLKESLLFTGPILDVETVIAACDLLVFPSTVGHFARPVIEAGFMAKPVVASDFPPMDELVLNNQTGYLVNVKDYDAWVDKLYLILNDKQLRSFLGNNAYQYCTDKFGIKRQIKVIEECYNDL